MIWLFTTSIITVISSTSAMKLQREKEGPLQGGGRLANEIMSTLSEPPCSILFFNDVRLEDNVVLQELNYANGIEVLDLRTTEKNLKNFSQSHLLETFKRGRQFRRTSWNVVVVVASENLDVLRTFATYSLNNRLLVWTSRVIVITRLIQVDLKQLLSSHWTFSMMNVIVLNHENERVAKWSVYSYLPYTQSGPRVVRLGVWMENQILRNTSNVRFFPEKFQNFHGAAVNISKLDYVPMWFPVIDRTRDGSLVRKMIGDDYELFMTVAKALNFTYREVPVASWAEVFEKVAEREAFITPVKSTVLETRMERFDFTLSFNNLYFSFAMPKPTITPNWMSLYSPLSNYVWLSVLISTILMPLIYVQVTKLEILHDPDEEKSIGWIAFTIFAVLAGQPQSGRLPKYDASRLAILTWFIFTFVVSTGYQGNLTAHLTLPKYPPRPETLEELVNYVNRITMPPWGTDYKNSFKKSAAPIMGRLADLIYIGPQPKEGLEQALSKRQAHLGGVIALTVAIDKHFTRRDGTPKFYLGKEIVIPARSAWPIPHDSPFKPNLDWCLQAVVEAGLYNKWTEEMLRFLRYENLRKKKEQRELQLATGKTFEEKDPDEDDKGGNRPMTLRHMQGTFGLYAIGIIISICAFVAEMFLRENSINE